MPDSLRIVLTSGNYNYIKDGVSLTLNRLVHWLKERGHEVLVIAPVAEEPAMEHAGRLEPVPSFAIPTRKEYRIGLRLNGRLLDEIDRFRPDLFHIAVPDITGHSTMKLAQKMGRPVVSSFHTRFDSYLPYYGLQFLTGLFHRRLRAFYDKCEHLYVPSHSMMEELRAAGIADANMRLWTRGVDHERFSPKRRSLEWRRARGISDDEVVISYAGRLVAEKNMKLMSRVFGELHKRGVKARTMLLGDGPEAGWMKNAMPDTVFAGFLHGDELATGYASSDVFFFPSITETFGNVTLEAMASGLPAVNADATGSRSLVREGETGFLVPVEREAEMADRLAELVGDGAMRKRFGAHARKIAESEHDWGAIFQKLEADYTEAIDGFLVRAR